MYKNLEALKPFDRKDKKWNVIIETPKSSQNKYDFDPDSGAFELGSVMPEGMTFPYDFGFLPSTLGDDGDPLDVLLLMDAPAFPGCVIPARLIGVIEARQTEDGGKPERNDRIVAVPCKARTYDQTRSIKDVDDNLIDEIGKFFETYNDMHGKKFKLLKIKGPKRAERLARQGMKKFGKQKRGKGRR
ncbi:MAG TPA: inorganic diphosphatase [Tepidisphaeraceae bacterium]|jgi:inorganic pyrophosphatase